MDSISKSSAEYYESPEESSWTMYFEDFSNKNTIDDDDHMNENTSIDLSHINHQTSSYIPDAACSAAGRRVFGASSDHNKKSKSLSSKKRKVNKGSSSAFVDHDLEDTATSPANSPKVYNLVNQFDKQKDSVGISHSQEIEGSALGKINDELGINGGENVGNELKKKGLCLVPVPMVVHYLG